MVVHSWGTFVYCPPECVRGATITLPQDEAHHLRHVLRMRDGQTVNATTGTGMIYRCSIQDELHLQIEETLPEFGETTTKISLAVGILKGDGNRDIADLATQLGAHRILFVHAARSEGQISENKLDRLKRAAISAIKQCGRARLPEIQVFPSVRQMLSRRAQNEIFLLAQQSHDDDFRPVIFPEIRSGSEIVICVGPEGGFDEDEIKSLEEANARRVSLAGRRLRTSVAAGAALSYCLGLIGEARGE